MYRTIREIKEANKKVGGHFFDDDTIRFFNSQPHWEVFAGRYFIDSTQYDETTPRMYTVKECVEGRINTIGDRGQYASLQEAKEAINSILTKES